MSKYQEKVLKQLKKVPKGKVTTYGRIADSIGLRNPRIVGYILHNNPDPTVYHCHRVVFADGKLTDGFAFGGIKAHAKLLKAEGIEVFDNKVVNLDKYIYEF